MKNYKYYAIWILCISVFGLLTSCEEDGDVSDGIRPVSFKATSTMRSITEGNTITYIDSSLNVKSRVWTFQEGSIATSDLQTVDVTYPTGTTLNADGTLPSYLTQLEVTHDDGSIERGKFLVGVYKKVNVDFTVNNAEVVVGGKAKFTQQIENLNSLFEESRAQDFVEWTFEGGIPATSSAMNPTVSYTELGTYKVTLTAHRQAPSSDGTKSVEGYITVVEPTPLVPSAAVELEDETISITFNGDFENISGQESFVKVKVNNIDFNVESLTVDANDSSKLNIKLTDPIYQDDDITVSLLPGSNITAIDTRAPETFTDLAVTSFVEQFLLSEGTFESALGTDWKKFSPNATVDGITEVLLVDPPTSSTTTNVVPTGKVVNLAINRNGGATMNNVNVQTVTAEVNLVAGRDYIIKFKRFVTSGTPNILFRFKNAGGANQLAFNPEAGDASKVNRWLESELAFKALGAHNGTFNVLSAWGSYADFYIDDIVIESNEKRP